MKNLLILFVIMVYSLRVIGQDTVFSRIYGGNGYETAVGADILNNDNVIVFGNTSSFGNGNMDFLVFGIDRIGDLRWEKYYGTENMEQATSYIKTRDNNYVICGITNRNTENLYDIWLVKIDSLGNKIWEKTYGTSEWDLAKDITEDENNNLLVCGQTYKNSATGDAFVFKLNAQGDSIWWTQMNAQNTDQANAIISYNNNIYIAGESLSFSGDSTKTGFLAKIDNSGSFIFQKAFTDTTESVFYDILRNGDSLILSGYIVQNNLKRTQYFLISNHSGQLVYSSFDYKTSNYEIRKGLIGNDGLLYFIGNTEAQLGNMQDFHFIKYTNQFNYLDARTYGKYSNEYVADFSFFKNKQMLILGTTNSFGNILSAIYLLKTDTLYYTPENPISISLSANSTTINPDIKIAPNPTNGFITLSSSNPKLLNSKIQVFNYLGQECAVSSTIQSVSQISLDLTSLENGIYFINLKTEEYTRCFKIIKAD